MMTVSNIFMNPFAGIDLSKIVEDTMEEKQLRILNLNRGQLDQGIDAKGQSLGQYKNFKYKNRYKPVDLKLKNDFRGKMTLSPAKGPKNKKTQEIFSQDQKTAKLEKQYGKDIMGLTDESVDRAGEIIKPGVQERYRKQLLKK